MNSISSIQSISQSVNLIDYSQYISEGQNVRQQSLVYEPSLSVDDGAKIPMEINMLSSSETEGPTMVENIMNGITEVDSDYQEIIDRLNAWPNFNGYLQKHGVSAETQMDDALGISHISNVDDIQKAEDVGAVKSNQELLDEKYSRIEALQQEQLSYYSAGIEYSQDSTLWSMNSTFWLSKIKILTSAVSSVSSGLKTLFMSQ